MNITRHREDCLQDKQLSSPLYHNIIIPTTTTLTFCCFQKIPAELSLYCCHWSCPWIHDCGSRCHDSRYHGFHCRVIRFHSHWSHCSSSPRPPRWVIGSEYSCDVCVVRWEGPARCCRCPPTGGLVRAHLGCSHPSGAAAPWSYTLRLP